MRERQRLFNVEELLLVYTTSTMSAKVKPDDSLPPKPEGEPDNEHTRISLLSMPPQTPSHSALFQFFEEPHSSTSAKRFADLMTVVVLGSIVVFCLETENVSDR